MNIDFIEASGIFTGKDTPFFGHLQHWSDNKATGRQTYVLEGCKKIQFYYTPSNGILVFRGSIMYFAQGHNFTFDLNLFVEAMDHLCKLLQVNLWDMNVNILECGVIVEVDRKPKDFIQNHREGQGMLLYNNPKDKGNFRSFNDKLAERKMYDAGRNIQHKQGTSMKAIIQEAGWNPEGHFLKWEVHYLKPEILLNQGHGILLAEIVNPHWTEVFKADIYSQYKRIIPMKSIIPPATKSDFRTLDLFAIELVETRLNEGRTIEEVRKLLYDRINASAILTKSDKDARRRQIRQTLDKLTEAGQSEWDISKKLEEALNLSNATLKESSQNPSDLIPL